MKKSIAALTLTMALALVMAGCASDKDKNTASPGVSPSQSAAPSQTVSPSQSAAPSQTVSPAPGDDSMNGGGAGGTNDRDNDGQPDAAEDNSGAVTSDSPIGRAGNAVGRGIEDAGNAVKNAADDVGRAMQGK